MLRRAFLSMLAVVLLAVVAAVGVSCKQDEPATGYICEASFPQTDLTANVGDAIPLDVSLAVSGYGGLTAVLVSVSWFTTGGGHFDQTSTNATLAGFSFSGDAKNVFHVDGPPGTYRLSALLLGTHGCREYANITLVVSAPSQDGGPDGSVRALDAGADASLDGSVRNVPDGGSDAGADASEGGADSGAAPSATFTLMSTGGLFPPQTFTVLTCGQGYAYLDVPAAVRTALNLPDDSYLGFFQTAPGVIDVYIKSGNTLYYDGHSDATYNSGTVPITSLTKSANGGATVTDTLTFYGTYTPCP